MKLKANKIKRIHIIGSNELKGGKVKIELFSELKPKKISSTNFPNLYGANTFQKRGDLLLDFWGLLEKDKFDTFYTLRGFIAERLIQQMLEKKNYKVTIYKDTYDIFEYNGSNSPLYKYFGGLPDIIYEDEHSVKTLLEIKSKELSKKEFIENTPPETEVLQGAHLALLGDFNTYTMTYVFFDEETTRMMYYALTEPFDIDESVKKFDEKMPNLQYKKHYDVIKKEYKLNKKETLEKMKEAYKYAETFRQTLMVDLDDLSGDVKHDLFELEDKLEDEYREHS